MGPRVISWIPAEIEFTKETTRVADDIMTNMISTSIETMRDTERIL
jgi:hypothetical protein